jgi:thiamine biosynthesis lipoprotein
VPEISFAALGTEWVITIDQTKLAPELPAAVQHYLGRFENAYSRFRVGSWVSYINRQPAGRYPLTPDQLQFLQFGFALRTATAGAFDPESGQWQVWHGYGPTLTFGHPQAPRPQPTGPLIELDISRRLLIKKGPTHLDLGGWGKGYAIDLVAGWLLSRQVAHFLIDAGGDFYGTSKADGSSWQIALRSPFMIDEAVGVFSLRQQALACSAPYYRQVKDFHHLLEAATGEPVRSVAATYVAASTAVVADGLATALFVSPSVLWPDLTHTYQASYLAVMPNGSTQYNPGFQANLFQSVQE